MFKYIEIKNIETGEVVSRFSVTGQSDRTIEKVISGVNINLNHKEYWVEDVESENELPIIEA